MYSRRFSGLGIVLNFSSHCRSVREESAEYPESVCSSAVTSPWTGASEIPANKNDAMAIARFIFPPNTFLQIGAGILPQPQSFANVVIAKRLDRTAATLQ